jgi:hypothetical protein
MAIRDVVLPVGPPVSLEWQIGRTRDIEQVRLAAENGEDIVLIDVRRTGKTTVALCALELLANAGQMVFPLDATENAPTTVDLAERLTRQLAAYRTAAANASAAALQAVRVLHEVGTGATNFIEDEQLRQAVETGLAALRPTVRTGVEQLDEILSEIGREAQSRGCLAVVLIDEVQAISEWEDAEELQGMLRTRLGAREGVPSFVFAGSAPTALDTLFRRGGMLAFHGITHQLGAITDADWREGLTRAFRELGCDIAEEAIEEALLESEGHPLRTMLVARETHRIVQTSQTPEAVTRGHVVAGAEAAKRQPLWRIDEVQ